MPQSKQIFAFKNPNGPKKLVARFLLRDFQDNWVLVEEAAFEYDFDIMDQQHVHKIRLGKHHGQNIFVTIFTDGCTKILQFCDNTERDEL